jgi:pyrroline-5-carboxylate reductase
MREKIGLIGFGNMGSAIYERAKNAFDLLVYEKDTSKTAQLEGPAVEADLPGLVSRCDALILAVKPQDFPALLQQLSSAEKTVISIAAGIPTAAIEKVLPRCRVIRVMPNLAASIGKAMSCIARGKSAGQRELQLAERIFKQIGAVMVIGEAMMDAATAISGSGPGFFFELVAGKSLHEAENYGRHMFAENLREAAVSVGFSGREAKALAEKTTQGAAAMLRETKIPPETLRDRVTSKGGTTEAGLKALRETHSLTEAAQAAFARARELAKG